jgi:hypothetical protein
MVICLLYLHVLIGGIVITGDGVPDRKLFRVVDPYGKLATAWADGKLR